eukprot:UN12988
MHFILKWIETSIGLILITIFGMIKFDCSICHDSATRMIFNNETNNDMILIYWIMGVSAHILDVTLYLVLYFSNILQSSWIIRKHGGKKARRKEIVGMIDEANTDDIDSNENDVDMGVGGIN